MDNDTFDKLLRIRIGKIQKVLGQKGKEYSSDVDRLHNFKVAAILESIPETPEQALWGMFKKHLVSVIDMIDKTGSGEFPSDEMRNEKIGDCINYFILLEALLIERRDNTEPFREVVEGTNAELIYKPSEADRNAKV